MENQEFGEVKATVSLLVDSLVEFRKETRESLKEFDVKVDTIIASQEKRIVELEKTSSALTSHERRISHLEKWKMYIMGIAGAVVSIWIVATTIITLWQKGG